MISALPMQSTLVVTTVYNKAVIFMVTLTSMFTMMNRCNLILKSSLFFFYISFCQVGVM